MNLSELFSASIDPKYKAFHEKLIPGHTILGIRTPVLEQYAKTLDPSFLETPLESSYEYSLLYGFVLGRAKLDLSSRLRYLKKWLPYNTNWASNDMVCARQKWMRKHKQEVLSFLDSLLQSQNEFDQRFAYTSFLMHFKEESDFETISQRIQKYKASNYYTQMALAWLLSEWLIKDFEKTIAFMETLNLDPFTYNKALQKTIESKRTPIDIKKRCSTLKRK
ncbi:DNA alkylation repair protein [Dubosiella newyorkensis]|jgi:3-methyladenine DNA glycosylase AlkD|uniref:DNA alkylation repair protein n=4 Tax=Dubosiella newyorkensis TaxID=1862672 RepID=A0A1U7NLY8_9FIRM|nr:DNA alkylation repair protein [Dubosiella newyorkensis]MCI9041851.1 DNA alkylation repair protein [Dubosiella newyorkensis]OLU46091.1 hypothetical protein BO225_07235 [Dubosiella newyorkensis]